MASGTTTYKIPSRAMITPQLPGPGPLRLRTKLYCKKGDVYRSTSPPVDLSSRILTTAFLMTYAFTFLVLRHDRIHLIFQCQLFLLKCNLFQLFFVTRISQGG